MSSSPIACFGDALVVVDGADRVAWRRTGLAEWAPCGVWPDEQQAADVRRHLAQGGPLLVVLAGTKATVPLLDEQLADAPSAVAALAQQPSGDLASLHIPALDWLPADLRRRGLRFVRESAERAARTPAPLLPAIVLSEPDAEAPNLRFAHRLAPCPHLRRDLPAIVEHAFGAVQRSVAA
jgi:hypothetical protein